MKKTILHISTFFILLCTTATIFAQENRTLDTKVVDILAQLPTNDLKHSDALMAEIIELGTQGILKFCDMLVPLGTGDDTQARFAIESVALYSGGLNSTIEVNNVEDALLIAIENTSNLEIKTFLMTRLMHCGSNTSVPQLSGYLQDETLYNPALSVLTTIGTKKASQAILDAAKNNTGNKQATFITALGNLHYAPAVGLLESLASSNSKLIRKNVVMALAEIASESSYNTLVAAAKNTNFKADKSEAVLAFIRYGIRLSTTNTKLSSKVANVLLKNCTTDEQLHFRTAALHILNASKEGTLTKLLLKEFTNQNKNYRGSVLDVASQNLSTDDVSKWVKAFKKSSSEQKIEIIRLLQKRKESIVFLNCIMPAIKNSDVQLRIAGIKALAFQNKSNALSTALQTLNKATSKAETKAIKETLLRLCDANDTNTIANAIAKTNVRGKAVLVEVLAARNATSQFDKILLLLNIKDANLKATVYNALASISTSANLSQLLELLNKADNLDNIGSVQQAIIAVLNRSKEDNTKSILDAFKITDKKERLLPVLPMLNNDIALQLVVKSLNSDNLKERLEALDALANWKNNDAISHLFQLATSSNDTKLQSKSFDYYLSQVNSSTHTNDQKLLLIKKLMPFSKTLDEQKSILNTAGSVKTFLSLIFVSNYLETKGLIGVASNAAIKIALPTPSKKDGLSGVIVRAIVLKSINNLNGPDSQYLKIDVTEFLNNMSNEEGFVSIFNGKDLQGWEGLVENPIARAKMSGKELAKAQTESNAQMLKDWFVKDGVIGFKGEGYNNICTIKDYGDFEMLVDWKITNGGDSGIYLRGTPQVQIWDIARTNAGAQVGSGGLYNNKKNESIPLVVADNLINDWNTFRITMVGERVTVYLNGVLVTNNIALENYWDRSLPIFTKEAIELQAHGEDLGFRNIYVREISSGNAFLSQEEIGAGFKSLFNGKDLDYWIGNKTDYFVENNELVVRPEQGGHGNLYTAEEYSDFNFRFEFKLTPGANNGLGIHTPLEGDAAYVGKELQILDNTAAIYSKLKPYQYHGSVYGVITAKRGFLKPVGEWNYEEVIIQGDHIKIILNGTVILDGNFKEASKDGTLDGEDHPGLKRNKGHIAFLGHGSELQFRNIRIKDLSK